MLHHTWLSLSWIFYLKPTLPCTYVSVLSYETFQTTHVKEQCDHLYWIRKKTTNICFLPLVRMSNTYTKLQVLFITWQVLPLKSRTVQAVIFRVSKDRSNPGYLTWQVITMPQISSYPYNISRDHHALNSQPPQNSLIHYVKWQWELFAIQIRTRTVMLLLRTVH
jgi:hypothetical protein